MAGPVGVSPVAKLVWILVKLWGLGAPSVHGGLWVPSPPAPHPPIQVMYGGRAIDSFDRRILTTYMDEYLGDFIFDTFQPFHFFQNKDVDYKIPAGDAKEKFVGEMSQT